MAVDTQQLYTILLTKFNAGTQSNLFSTSFNHALTRVFEDLESDKVGISISIPIDQSQPMDCDSEYYGVIFDGLVLYLQELGFWGLDMDKTYLDGKYERSLRRAHTHYMGTQTVYTLASGA